MNSHRITLRNKSSLYRLLLLILAIPAVSARAQSASTSQDCFVAPAPHAEFGLGFQFSSSSQFLLSWQTAPTNNYGSSWRFEPAVGVTYNISESDNPSRYTSSPHTTTTNISWSLGLGVYRRWRVRAPFDNLYFTCGPRLVESEAFSSLKTYDSTDTQMSKSHSQGLSTTLSIQAGPEYDFAENFSFGGFLSLGATIRGRPTTSPATISTWGFSLATTTGIILRYYFN